MQQLTHIILISTTCIIHPCITGLVSTQAFPHLSILFAFHFTLGRHRLDRGVGVALGQNWFHHQLDDIIDVDVVIKHTVAILHLPKRNIFLILWCLVT